MVGKDQLSEGMSVIFWDMPVENLDRVMGKVFFGNRFLYQTPPFNFKSEGSESRNYNSQVLFSQQLSSPSHLLTLILGRVRSLTQCAFKG